MGSAFGMQQALNQQQADLQLQQMRAQWWRPGGHILVDNIHDILAAPPKPPVYLYQECTYCGRVTKKVDFEHGCAGCGAHEWRNRDASNADRR